MPASTAKVISKKGSSKSLSADASKVASKVAKQKSSAKDEAVRNDQGAKKLKGKEKAQRPPIEKAEKAEKVFVETPVPKKKKKAEVSGKELEESTRRKIENSKPASKKEKENKTEEGKRSAKKKAKKLPTPSPDSSDASDAEDVGEETRDAVEDKKKKESGSEEDEEYLHGFSSEESDSSDEDDDEVDKASFDVGKLPTVAKDDATVKMKLEKAKRQATEDRGVIYLGRIPHGFYEDQMKAYFSQFGDVSRLRLSRNKKTGRSKHYAFIEFSSSAVAQIVAETMNNYLLMGRLLRCELIPKEKVHPELWVGANRKFRSVKTDRIERLHQNKTRTDEEKKNVERRLVKRQEQKKRKLQALGIDYDFGSVSYSKRVKQTA